MRRWIWVAVVIVVAVGAIWGWPRLRAAQVERAAAAIEATDDPAERVEKAVAFLTSNTSAPVDVVRRVLAAGVRGASDQGGPEAVVAFCDRLMPLQFCKAARGALLTSLDGALLESSDPNAVARANDLAREVVKTGGYPAMTYLYMAWQHSASESADPRATVDLALAGAALGDSATASEWPGVMDRAYASLFAQVARERGLDEAIAAADSVVGKTQDPLVAGSVYANVYRLLVEDDPAGAVSAARSLASLSGFKGSSVMNDVAYDLATRDLAPDVAVELAEAALVLAPSRYDSVLVLDTAGWARYRAGDHAAAVAHLSKAFSMLDETPSFGNEIVAHLVTSYKAAGKTDEAIDLLALLVARSVDPADPARAELSALLRKRDGSDAAMKDLVAAKADLGLSPAPDFALAGGDGKTVTLAGLRGNVVLVCFWSYG